MTRGQSVKFSARSRAGSVTKEVELEKRRDAIRAERKAQPLVLTPMRGVLKIRRT